MSSIPAVAALTLALAGCRGTGPRVDMETLVQSLGLDPPIDLSVECPPLPSGTQQVLFAGVFSNSPPIMPGTPAFPSTFCPPTARFFARAEGRGNSSLLGDFVWVERYCTVPPGRLVAEGSFHTLGGDSLTWEAQVQFDSVPPPIPFATFKGTFTFTGGSGAYAGASGKAVVRARQLGDAAPGRPAGSTAAAVCGWLSTSHTTR